MFEHFVFDWRDLLDIALVSALLYQVIQLLRGSRALAVLTGLGLLTLLYFMSRTMGLYTLTWLLQHIFSSLFILIVVIFQADIRQALGEMGAHRLFRRRELKQGGVEEVVMACVEMARLRVGALIVIERSMRLGDMIKREGVRVDAQLSRQLLMNIFLPKAPLHDGAGGPSAADGSWRRPAFCRWPLPKPEFRHPPPGGSGHHPGKRRRGRCRVRRARRDFRGHERGAGALPGRDAFKAGAQ